jgi:hypothetical protein
MDLISVGVTPNKTKECRLPFIDDAFFWSFLRGFSDGDGCVYFSPKRKISSWSLTCHEDVAVALKEKLECLTGIHVTIQPHWRTSYIKILSINGNQNVYLFLKRLYDGATIYLNRKFLKYMEFKRWYESRLKFSVSIKPFGIEKTTSGKFSVRIKHHDNRTYLGCYETEQEAAKVYDAALIEIHGENCITNQMIHSL